MQRFIFTTKGLFKASECSSDRAFRWYFSNTGETLHLSEILRESWRTTQQETCSHAMPVIRFIYFTPSSLTLTSFRNDYVDICTCTGIFTGYSFLSYRMETFYCLRTTYKGEDEIVKWYKLCTIPLHIYINTIKYRYINTKHFSLNYQWQLYEMFCTLYQKNDSFSRCTKQKEIFITARYW